MQDINIKIFNRYFTIYNGLKYKFHLRFLPEFIYLFSICLIAKHILATVSLEEVNRSIIYLMTPFLFSYCLTVAIMGFVITILSSKKLVKNSISRNNYCISYNYFLVLGFIVILLFYAAGKYILYTNS